MLNHEATMGIESTLGNRTKLEFGLLDSYMTGKPTVVAGFVI
jgi:hypothetical protein